MQKITICLTKRNECLKILTAIFFNGEGHNKVRNIANVIERIDFEIIYFEVPDFIEDTCKPAE